MMLHHKSSQLHLHAEKQQCEGRIDENGGNEQSFYWHITCIMLLHSILTYVQLHMSAVALLFLHVSVFVLLSQENDTVRDCHLLQ